MRAGLDGMKDGQTGVDVAVKGAEVWKPMLQPLLKKAAPEGAPEQE